MLLPVRPVPVLLAWIVASELREQQVALQRRPVVSVELPESAAGPISGPAAGPQLFFVGAFVPGLSQQRAWRVRVAGLRWKRVPLPGPSGPQMN